MMDVFCLLRLSRLRWDLNEIDRKMSRGWNGFGPNKAKCVSEVPGEGEVEFAGAH